MPAPVPVRAVDHIGIAVASLAGSRALYGGTLGFPIVHEEEVASQKVRVAFYRAGTTLLEVLEPTSPDGPVGRFLAKRGPGLHHVAFSVPDVAAALGTARAAGVELVDEKPRRGARGHLVAFLHPRSTGGVLTELVQEASR